MCNQRDTTLPATVTAFSNPSRLSSRLASSGADLPLRDLLRELLVAPALRRLQSDGPERASARDRELEQSRSNLR
jgi:hypothetical protein